MTLDFIDQLIKDKYPLAYGFEFDPENIPEKGRFIASDGMYTLEKTPNFDMFYRESKNDFNFGGKLREFLTPRADMPRVPIKIMATIFSFYREVYQKSKTEVQVNVYWNFNKLDIPETPGLTAWGNDLYTYVPKQIVSSVRTTYEASKDPLYMWLVDNLMVVIDTHSHHSMEAFMSGTDRDNSDRPAVYLDLGHIMQDIAHLHAWAARDNQHILEDLESTELYKFIEELPHVDEYITTPTYSNNFYQNKKYNPITKVWESNLPAATVKTFNPVTKILEDKPAVTTPVATSSVKKLVTSTTEQFNSKQLLEHAVEVPAEWHEQITYQTYAVTGTYSSAGRFNQNAAIGQGIGYDYYGFNDYALDIYDAQFSTVTQLPKLDNDKFEALLSEGATTILSIIDPWTQTTEVFPIEFTKTGKYKKQLTGFLKSKLGLNKHDLENMEFSFMSIAYDESLLLTVLNEHTVISEITEKEMELVAKLQFISELFESDEALSSFFELTTTQLDTIYDLVHIASISEDDNKSMKYIIDKIYAKEFMLVDTLDKEHIAFAESLNLHATNARTRDMLELYVK